MSSFRLTIALIALMVPFQLFALPKSGAISGDETWLESESPILVDDLVTVDRDVTLTIEAGCIIKFVEGSGIIVEGRISAVGTETDSIVFTSDQAKTAGAWGGIYLYGNAGGESAPTTGIYESNESIFEYCVIEYAGNAAVESGSAMEISNASPRIANTSLRNSEGQSGTIKCGNRSKPLLLNCNFDNNSALRGGAMSVGLGSYPVVQGCRFAYNSSGDHGGAIYISLASMEINGSAFIANKAQAHGGAIYSGISPDLKVNGNAFTANKSNSGSNILYITNRVTATISDNMFDNFGQTGFSVYLESAAQEVDAKSNYWGDPTTLNFTNLIRDRNLDPAEPFVQYNPFLWAPPINHLLNPSKVDSIILCRDDNYTEEIPRGVAEGAPLRIRLAGVDRNPSLPDLVRVRITSELDPDGMLMALRETSPNSGIWTGRGRVDSATDQEDYAVGDYEGGEIQIVAPFSPDVTAVYQTMSPKPLAENLRVELSEGVDFTHLIDHSPEFHWDYFDVVEVPQKSFWLTVTPSDGGSPVWDTGEIKSNDKSITYAGTELEDGKRYSSEIKVWNGRFWSEPIELSLRMNSLPSAPQPVKPSKDELADTLSPQMMIDVSMDSEDDSLLYRFEIYEGEAITPMQTQARISDIGESVVWTAPEALIENETYRFRVQASDPLESGKWSEDRIFHINATEEAAAAFNLTGPIDGAQIYLLHPTFSWDEAVDPDPLSSVKYTLEVGKSSELSEPRIYENLTELSFTIPDSLDNETEYFWRITAIDNTDRKTLSNTAGNFNVYTTPTVPVQDAPLAGEERQPQDLLTWQASEDPNPDDIITYEVEVFDSESLEERIAYITGLSETSAALESFTNWEDLIDNGIYFWHVQSRDNHTAASGYSNAGSFFFNRYNDLPDSISTVNAPADTVMGTTDITFSWEAVNDPDLSDPPSTLIYELQCTLNEFTDSDVSKFDSEPGVPSITANLEDNRLWKYRLRTRDDEGAVSGWTPEMTVLVNYAEDAPTNFTLEHPRIDSLVVELDSLLFTWQASTDPDWESSITYRLELTPQNGDPFTVECTDAQFHYKDGLTNEMTYTWRVIAIDNTGLETITDESFTFTTSTTPEIPIAAEMPAELMPPDPLAFHSTTDPNPSDILTYTVEISPNENFSSLFVHVEGVEHNEGIIHSVISGLTDQEKLEDDVDYYFRVRATDNHGYDGAFSTPHLFRFNRVNDNPEMATAPFSPLDTVVVNDRNPLLKWGAASDEDLSDPPEKLVYEIRLDKDWELEKNNAYFYETNPGMTDLMPPNPLQDNTPWVWQVRTKDDDGAVSDWSIVHPFLVNVQEDAPSVPVLTVPSKDVTMNILGPIDFDWDNSADPDYLSSITYNIEYGVEDDLSDGKRIDGLENSEFNIEGPLENTTYYWRVTAVDNTGLETASEIHAFSLDTKPTTPEPITLAPVVELTPDGQLNWTLSSDPNPDDKLKYELSISVDIGSEGNGEETTVAEANNITVPMSDILGDNMMFNWRVRAVDNHGIASEWSESSKFFYNLQNDPPNKIEVLNAPAAGVEVSTANLSWEPTTDIDFSDTPDLLSYKVELSQEEDFSGDVIGIKSKPAVTTLTPSGLADDTRWYWRVRGVDDDNAEGDPSPVRDFILNTQNDAPFKVDELIRPEDGAEITSPALSWKATNDKDITDPDQSLIYKVELSESKDFSSNIVTLNSQPGTTSLIASEISDNTVWYWKVSGMDDEGATGQPSSVRSFNLNSGNDSPLKVTGLKSVTATPSGGKVTISWSETSDPDISDLSASLKYQVEFNTNESFTSGSLAQNTAAGILSLEPEGLIDNNIYFFRIRAIDDEGSAGEWSETKSFVNNMANDAPQAFSLLEPVNNGKLTSSTVQLKWSIAKDIDPNDTIEYTLQIAKDADFTTGLNTIGEISSTSYQVANELIGNGGQFFWRVSASDGNGGTSWGSGSDKSPWSFEVQVPTPGQ